MSRPSIDVLLKNEVTAITGGRSGGRTALLLETAAENSNRGNTSLIVLRDMQANEFYDDMMKLKAKYDVSNVAVVKIQDFDGDFSGLTKDANTFDRVFFEGIYSAQELATLPTFLDAFTFGTTASEGTEWADFIRVLMEDSGEEVIKDGG